MEPFFSSEAPTTTMVTGLRRPLVQEGADDDPPPPKQASSSSTGPHSQLPTSAPTSAPTSTASYAVSFPINTEPASSRVLWVSQVSSTFNYVLNETVVPNKIGWYFKPDRSQSQEYELLDGADFNSNEDNSNFSSTSPFLYDVTRYNVHLNLSALRVKTDLASDLSRFARRQDDLGDRSRLLKKMVVRIHWTEEFGSTGYSQSGVFTVAQPADPPPENMVRGWMDRLEDRSGTQVPLSRNASAGQGTGGFSGDSGEGQPTPTSKPAQGSQVSGGGRLSPGAIVGIALGVGLALVLIGAGLAWFLLRRRRQKQRETASAAKRLTSKTSMEDKNMRAAHMADSPRSPYSDEQNQSLPVSPLAAHPPGEGGAGGTGLTPQDVNVTALRSSHSGADHHQDQPQAQRGVSNTVAHLVEDGMTAEEIRRLEDEESQLDAEIERAARR